MTESDRGTARLHPSTYDLNPIRVSIDAPVPTSAPQLWLSDLVPPSKKDGKYSDVSSRSEEGPPHHRTVWT